MMGFCQVTNLNFDSWSNPLSWSNNTIPSSNDSVYLSYDIIIDINASCKSFNTNGLCVVMKNWLSFSS